VVTESQPVALNYVAGEPWIDFGTGRRWIVATFEDQEVQLPLNSANNRVKDYTFCWCSRMIWV